MQEVIAPKEAPFPVRPVDTQLTDAEIYTVAEATMVGNPVFTGYSVVEVVPDKRRQDRAWVAVRKGDTYVTYCLLMGFSGYGSKRRMVALFQWGNYGLSSRDYAANLHRRAA